MSKYISKLKTMSRKGKLIVLLVFLECIFSFLTYKAFQSGIEHHNNEINKNNFNVKYEVDGEYVDWTGSAFPSSDDYELDLDKTSCVNKADETINNAISYANSKVTVSTNQTLYCTLYFYNAIKGYTVYHYQENIDVAEGAAQNTTNYTLKDTDNLTGRVGTNVTPEVKTYTGFTAPSKTTVTILRDGSAEVNYYYTRNQYTLTLNYSVLPTGYTELDNIKFTRGSATSGYYFDMGFKGTNTIGFEADFIPDLVGATAESTIFGSRNAWDVNRYHLSAYGNGGLELWGDGYNSGYNCQYYTKPNQSISLSMTQGSEYKMTFNKSGSLWSYSTSNGKSGTLSAFSFSTPSNMLIAALDMTGYEYNCGSVTRGPGKWEFGSMTLKRLRFFNNGNIIRDFIPAKNSSGTICLFDTANNTVYYSQNSGGSGSLTAGTVLTISTTKTVTYDSSMPSITVPTKKGYTFYGYYDAKSNVGDSCSGNQYYNSNGASVKNYDKTSNITLYACWKLNKDETSY